MFPILFPEAFKNFLGGFDDNIVGQLSAEKILLCELKWQFISALAFIKDVPQETFQPSPST
jgi:hypothetical protein